MLTFARDVLVPAGSVDPELRSFVEGALDHTLRLVRQARRAGEPHVAREYLEDTVAELTFVLAERGILLPIH